MGVADRFRTLEIIYELVTKYLLMSLDMITYKNVSNPTFLCQLREQKQIRKPICN